jgi:dihydroorotate dehydrogenase electron transfer subunit
MGEPTRSMLIPFELTNRGFECTAPSERNWGAGDELDLLGPIGRGFKPPAASRRWLLLSIDTAAGPLMPLVQLARDQGASISIWANTALSELPPDVEIATDLQGAIDWSDYLAICATPSGLPGIRSLPGLTNGPPLAGIQAEALLLSPMPCGFGGCMACAVRVRHGWKLCCQDGPVFPLEALAW